MYEQSIMILKKNGVELEKGLTSEEIFKIEKIYGIRMPRSLRDFLMSTLPISAGFYNWRNTRQDNIRLIKQVINRPVNDIYDMAEEVYWCDDWGVQPKEKKIVEKEVRNRLKDAPKLIPVYGHRYIPVGRDDNPPIISIHNVDIIYYGLDIKDYIEVEFSEKKQNEIEFKRINHIQFWSDIM